MALRLLAGLFGAIFLCAIFIPEISCAQDNGAPDSQIATSTITDDEIDGFLFRVNEDIKNEIMELGGETVTELSLPVLFGVSIGEFGDTWGEARASGRVHTGTDIIAPKGELIVSPTQAVVTKIGRDNKGGNYVITANPGGEQFYYAHLDAVAETIIAGTTLEPGDLIGYVGNTGNARGKSPHLHFSIYYKGLAKNPFPRLVREFSMEEKISALQRIFLKSKTAFGTSGAGARFLQRFLINADSGPQAKKLALIGSTGYFGQLTKKALAEYQQTISINPANGYFGPVTKANIFAVLMPEDVSLQQVAGAKIEIDSETEVVHADIPISKNLELGDSGDDVNWLQNFLIDADVGANAKVLATAGATGYFGQLTKKSLAEYQDSVGINPASGYFGPLTRAWIKNASGPN